MSERDLSVVVLGASGVTGRRVAAYLAERAGELGASWAAAGRDPAKVRRMLGEIGVNVPETIAADVGDPAALAALASRARVVLDLVGPYALHGEPVIEACIAAGAHYVDLTGEIPFVRRMIDRHHARAAAAGVKVVQVCGFEALPPDLSVLLAAETAHERWGEGLAAVDVDIVTQQPSGLIGLGDLISGGTLQSVSEMVADREAAAIADPAALIPDPAIAAAVRSRSPIPLTPRVNGGGDAITPMVPVASINPPVIHRTWALLAEERDEPTAQPPAYRDGVGIPGGPASLPLRYAAAAALGGAHAGFRALVRARPAVRARAAALMRRALPSSGFGPQDRLEEWSWQLTAEASTAAGRHVRIEVEAEGHPGYLTTAALLGEVGLLLAEEGATPARAGCLTPATALGTGRLERLTRAGARFSVAS